MGHSTTYSSLIHLKFSRLIYHTSKLSFASIQACISPSNTKRAYSIGSSIASVARRLGHASMTTTQKTYLHIIQELENKAVDLVMTP